MAVDPKRVEAVFLAAAKQADAAARAAYLDGASAGEPELRKRVEGLLRGHDQLGAALLQTEVDESARELATDGLPTSVAESAPGHGAEPGWVGPYKLLQFL